MTDFLHSGGLGDVIMSLPLVKHLGGGTMHVKPSNPFNSGGNNFLALRALLEAQPYIEEVKSYPVRPFFRPEPGISIDVDLDRFRRLPNLANTNLVDSYFIVYGLPMDGWRGRPWLTVPDYDHLGLKDGYSVIHRTARYQDSRCDWNAVPLEKCVFLGNIAEYRAFCRQWGRVDYIFTHSLLEMAQVIQGAEALYCNQSVGLTIAHGLGKTVFLEVAPGHNNCIFDTPNENFLNR